MLSIINAVLTRPTPRSPIKWWILVHKCYIVMSSVNEKRKLPLKCQIRNGTETISNSTQRFFPKRKKHTERCSTLILYEFVCLSPPPCILLTILSTLLLSLSLSLLCLRLFWFTFYNNSNKSALLPPIIFSKLLFLNIIISLLFFFCR